jgi:hypothetical protein
MDSNPPSKKKKRKLQADAESADVATVIDVPPEVSLRVACLDGSSLDLKAPAQELVRGSSARSDRCGGLKACFVFVGLATAPSCFGPAGCGFGSLTQHATLAL